MIVLILYINLLNLSWIIKYLVLRNMGTLTLKFSATTQVRSVKFCIEDIELLYCAIANMDNGPCFYLYLFFSLLLFRRTFSAFYLINILQTSIASRQYIVFLFIVLHRFLFWCICKAVFRDFLGLLH